MGEAGCPAPCSCQRGRQALRAFAANPLDATASMYEDLVKKSVAEYKANEKDVARDLDAELASNKMVPFMEGTPDAPKSELSMNVVKMLTQAQASTFLSVDVLPHPAILGYTVTKSQRNRAPISTGRPILRRSRWHPRNVQER